MLQGRLPEQGSQLRRTWSGIIACDAVETPAASAPPRQPIPAAKSASSATRCARSSKTVATSSYLIIGRPLTILCANALWTGDDNFDLDIVDSPEELEALIRQRADQGHTSRLVAGYCWPWSAPRDDGTLANDIEVEGWGRPWNARPNATGPAEGIPKSYYWASEPGGIDQVGCIYTAQGFEVDYVGVIFGNDLVYRPREGWIGRKEFSYDGGLKRGTSDEDFTRLIKNTYRVLLSRGLKGAYLYFTDEKTRDFVESRIDRLAVELAAKQAGDYTEVAP